MANITLITVGTLKESYIREGVDEYKKRLCQYARVNEINIKEHPIKNESDASEIKRALDAEAEKILMAVPKDSFVISLCVEGHEYDSPALAKFIEQAINDKGRLTLIIGSSHGLSEKVKKESHERLSFSKLTFPHQLMRVLLLEALYRSFTIISGKRYHK